jgi:hypothetical protein
MSHFFCPIDLTLAKETRSMTLSIVRRVLRPFGSPRRNLLHDNGLTHMNTACVVITLTTAAVTAAIAVADFIAAGFVLANSAEVGMPRVSCGLLVPVGGLVGAAGGALKRRPALERC